MWLRPVWQSCVRSLSVLAVVMVVVAVAPPALAQSEEVDPLAEGLPLVEAPTAGETTADPPVVEEVDRAAEEPPVGAPLDESIPVETPEDPPAPGPEEEAPPAEPVPSDPPATPSVELLEAYCSALDGFFFSRTGAAGLPEWQCFFTADAGRDAFPYSLYQETSQLTWWGSAYIFFAACTDRVAFEVQPLVPGHIGPYSLWEITRVACGIDL